MCVSETERRGEQGSKHTLELTRFLGIIRSAHLYLRNAKSWRGIKHGCILPNSCRWLASALPGSWQILLAVFPPVKHSPMPSVLAFTLHARSPASELQSGRRKGSGEAGQLLQRRSPCVETAGFNCWGAGKQVCLRVNLSAFRTGSQTWEAHPAGLGRTRSF